MRFKKVLDMIMEVQMKKLLLVLPILAAILFGTTPAIAQEEEVGLVEPELTLPMVWRGVEFIDPAPQISVMFRTRNKDEVPLTSFSLIRKTWALPVLEMNVSLGLDAGALIGENNSGDSVAFDLKLASGVMVGGVEQPLAWLGGKVPLIGKYLERFIGMADGRAGYGGTFDFAGLDEFCHEPREALKTYADHGAIVGLLSWKREW